MAQCSLQMVSICTLSKTFSVHILKHYSNKFLRYHILVKPILLSFQKYHPYLKPQKVLYQQLFLLKESSVFLSSLFICISVSSLRGWPRSIKPTCNTFLFLTSSSMMVSLDFSYFSSWIQYCIWYVCQKLQLAPYHQPHPIFMVPMTWIDEWKCCSSPLKFWTAIKI